LSSRAALIAGASLIASLAAGAQVKVKPVAPPVKTAVTTTKAA
jgi:hypothetical protein